jgi:hypothetical protein
MNYNIIGFLQKLIVAQLVKNSPLFIDPDGSLP